MNEARAAAVTRATGGMVVATLLWGATFVVLRDVVARLDPGALVCLRFGAAAILLGIVAVMRGQALDRTVLVGGLVSGLFTAAGYLWQAIGLRTLSAGSSAFLTSTGTLFAGLFAWPLLGQPPGPLLAAGLALATFGSALLAGPTHLGFGPGEIWTLLGAFAYALQIVTVARFAARVDAATLAGVQAAVVAVALAPSAAGHLGAFRNLDPLDWARLGYLVVAGSVIAPLLQVYAQRTLPAGRIGLLFALEPVFALLFAVGVAGERFAPRWWWGAALILCAVSMVEGHAAWRSAWSRRASA